MASKTNKRVAEWIDQMRTILSKLRLKPIETVVLVLTFFFAGMVGYFYIFEVRSRTVQLDGLDGRENRARTRILDAGTRKKKFEAQRSNASLIVESIQSFEQRLKNREQGTPAIISEVNSLARQHRVTAGDYNYRVIESESDKPTAQSAATKRDDSQLHAYTALGIETTVVGDYDDLRRLIAAVERSRQFIVINVVSFQGEADRPGQTAGAGAGVGLPAGVGAPVRQDQVAPQNPMGGQGGIPVSLKIEMETYFRNETLR
ncbi:MAG: hypothetical protein ABI882_23810 [Acidobacteriota bacterium]